MSLFFALLILNLIVCIGFIHRNNEVFRYRREMIQYMHDLNMNDIENLRPFTWRYKLFNDVSYEEMLWKFWKPIDSFWDLDKFENGHE